MHLWEETPWCFRVLPAESYTFLKVFNLQIMHKLHLLDAKLASQSKSLSVLSKAKSSRMQN